MNELERTFLAKSLPDLEGKHKEMIDIYIPKEDRHPIVRIRKNGEKYEITKKYPKVEGDSSVMVEHTIPLTPEEFASLSQIEGKRVEKKRYVLEIEGREAEVDVFQADLKGLVLIDFEFDSMEEKDAFQMPSCCLAGVTHEESIAGGYLCGKSYADIEGFLNKYHYTPL